jgi:hypothetical protein
LQRTVRCAARRGTAVLGAHVTSRRWTSAALDGLAGMTYPHTRRRHG